MDGMTQQELADRAGGGLAMRESTLATSERLECSRAARRFLERPPWIATDEDTRENGMGDEIMMGSPMVIAMCR